MTGFVQKLAALQRRYRWTVYQACVRIGKRVLGLKLFYTLGRPLRQVERGMMRGAFKPLEDRRRGTHGLFGVNLVCHASSESGLGEGGRSTLRSLDAAHIPVSLLNEELPGLRAADTSVRSTSQEAHPYAISILQVNPDHLVRHLDMHGTGWFDDRYVIGYWSWELLEIPDLWKEVAPLFDEIWTLSTYSQKAIAAAVPVPVYAMPLAIATPTTAHKTRSAFGLPDDTYTFLFMFDFHSRMERKHPLGLIDAFRRAFPCDERVQLVIKHTNALHFPHDAALLQQAAEKDPRIQLLDGYIDRADIGDLLRCCDAYVSLHRAEGFGLTIAEAMLLGKPAIATAYSGSMDFMLPDTCLPVGYTLTTSPRHDGPYPKGCVWAEPNLDDAARHMRFLYEHPEEGTRIGKIASQSIKEHHSAAVIGEKMATRIREILPDAGN